MYRIYTTEGWVLGGINVGENNRYIDLFTRDFGLVRGVAQSVRKLESKLRYGLQDLSYSKFSLVRGREVWRIVNVEKLLNFDSALNSRDFVALISRVFSLVKRLVKGEEKDLALFDDINLALELTLVINLSEEQYKNFETILVYRTLHKLGYIPENKQLGVLVDFFEWNKEIVNIDQPIRASMVRQINESLLHSHL